jgi:hypothetical protein
MESCHVGHTGTHLNTKVKQRWARLAHGCVTTQMPSMPDAVRRCTHILRTGKASEKTPRGIIPPVWVKYRRKKKGKKEKKDLQLELRESPQRMLIHGADEHDFHALWAAQLGVTALGRRQ